MSINRHEIWEYVIYNIYLSNLKNDQKIMFLIQREIHLRDNLKINIFFNNDITNIEKFIINMTKKRVIINNIETFIVLNIRSFKIAIQRLIHLRKIIDVFSYVEIIISIYNFILSNSENFLFESNNDLKLSMYVYFVDAFTFFIIIRNEQNVSIQILKNYRLNRISKFDFSNVFYIDDSNENNVRHLIVKKFKFVHRIDWFKKFMFVYVTIYVVIVAIDVFIVETFIFIVIFIVETLSLIIISSILVFDFVLTFIIKFELRKFFANFFNIKKFFANFFNSKKITFSNDIIIYNSFVTNSFAQIIKNFSTFWHETKFVKMSKKNEYVYLSKLIENSKFSTKSKYIFEESKIVNWLTKRSMSFIASTNCHKLSNQRFFRISYFAFEKWLKKYAKNVLWLIFEISISLLDLTFIYCFCKSIF